MNMPSTVTPPKQKDAPAKPREEQPEAKQTEVALVLSTVSVEFPLAFAEGDKSYVSSEIHVRNLTVNQRSKLRDLLRGLCHAGAVLENGKQVRDKSDAVRWVLEQL